MIIAILGYPTLEPWDPDTVKLGLPGSEEAAVYVYNEILLRKHKITMYFNPPENSRYSDWKHANYWYNKSNKETYDLVILWRREDVQNGRLRGKKVFFWSHDSPRNNFNLSGFDGFLPLTKFHREQFTLLGNVEKIPYEICGNGIIPETFKNNRSHNVYSVGYFSNYARGLIYLLRIWPFVVQEFPTATLTVCYGRDTWGLLNKEQTDHLVDMMVKYNVNETGKIGHQELADTMTQTSIWAYPCNTLTETFCITAVKAQMAGMIPVVNRVAALKETVSPEAPCIEYQETNYLFSWFPEEDYLNLLLKTMRNIENEKKKRKDYQDFARKFTWKKCVDHWFKLYQKIKT